MASLAVCMIVKNEEEKLEKSLISAASFADELIVVDTGSTDATMEIAGKYTDKLYTFPWCDDFSAARNASYEKASADYLMWFDADNSMEPEECEKMRRLKENLGDEQSVFLYLSSAELGRKRWDHRITRRNPALSWHNLIHEQFPIREPVRFEPITILHEPGEDVEELYLQLIRRTPREDIASEFWFAAQCCHDFIRAGRPGEAEQYRRMVLNGNWPPEEQISPSIDAAHVLQYYGFYREALWWYDLLLKNELFRKESPREYYQVLREGIRCRRLTEKEESGPGRSKEKGGAAE